MKKIFEPVFDSIKSISEDLTKTMTEIFIKNNKALENFDDKLLRIKNDRSKTAS